MVRLSPTHKDTKKRCVSININLVIAQLDDEAKKRAKVAPSGPIDIQTAPSGEQWCAVHGLCFSVTNYIHERGDGTMYISLSNNKRVEIIHTVHVGGKLVVVISPKWLYMFNLLLNYVNENDTAPSSTVVINGHTLGRWYQAQRCCSDVIYELSGGNKKELLELTPKWSLVRESPYVWLNMLQKYANVYMRNASVCQSLKAWVNVQLRRIHANKISTDLRDEFLNVHKRHMK